MSEEVNIRTKPDVLVAWQYNGEDTLKDAPPWLEERLSDRWKGVEPVTLFQIDRCWHLSVPVRREGPTVVNVIVRPSDWIIYNGRNFSVVPHHEFERVYERI